jgi:ferredoxin-type protein NapH
MNNKLVFRQRLRRTLILTALLLFPLTINYLSPYLIIDGAAQGIVNGSFILFTLLFLSSLFLGRSWCSWICPGGGLGEACFYITDKKVSQKGNWIKWLIWIPWMGVIIFLLISAGGILQIKPFYMMENYISIDRPEGFIIYYFVVILIALLSLTLGRRAFCHYACWMAPFLIIGRKLRNFLGFPALKIASEEEKCIDCKLCTQNCPMSLDVNALVHKTSMEHSECILCGNCVDTCPHDVIHYGFSKGK